MQQFAMRKIDKERQSAEGMEQPEHSEPGPQSRKGMRARKNEQSADERISCDIMRQKGKSHAFQYKSGKRQPEEEQ